MDQWMSKILLRKIRAQPPPKLEYGKDEIVIAGTGICGAFVRDMYNW